MKNVMILSDSTGETAEQYVHAIMANFNTDGIAVVKHSHVEEEDLDALLAGKGEDTLVFATIVAPGLLESLQKRAKAQGFRVYDLLGDYLKVLEEFLDQKAIRKPGLSRKLDQSYFDRIEAIEFAVQYDDGKDPRGIQKADVVLIGVSRTSKTPVCMTLAYKGIKACNIPMVPEVNPPRELFIVDPHKIIALVISPDKLMDIRKDRLSVLGLHDEALYAEEQRIREELEHVYSVVEKIGCRVMDVSEKTIIQTASLIEDMVLGE